MGPVVPITGAGVVPLPVLGVVLLLALSARGRSDGDWWARAVEACPVTCMRRFMFRRTPANASAATNLERSAHGVAAVAPGHGFELIVVRARARSHFAHTAGLK